MLTYQLEIMAIASIVAASTALVGVFLVLRRMSLMSDAISHSILLGIVLAFFIVESTSSPFMLVAATLTGVLTVLLVETLVRTGLVKEDASIGLVFPLLFSIGVVLISRYAANVHLDVDSVILGELAFAPFDRLEVAGQDFGPRTLWLAGAVLIIDLVIVLLFYKELKLATFDAGLAATLGLSPVLIHYGLMTLVSVTAVSSFEAVGSVLVVALMIAPPAAAYLLTDRLPVMMVLSVAGGVLSALGGYAVAYLLDASIAGSMAAVAGLVFTLALVFAPQQGLVARWLRLKRQRYQFAGEMLLVHLSQHEMQPGMEGEASLEHLGRHLRWDPRFSRGVVAYVTAQRLVRAPANDGHLVLTDRGRAVAQQVMLR
jgi:manganese/zinc/iron transport system permease protein